MLKDKMFSFQQAQHIIEWGPLISVTLTSPRGDIAGKLQRHFLHKIFGMCPTKELGSPGFYIHDACEAKSKTFMFKISINEFVQVLMEY